MTDLSKNLYFLIIKKEVIEIKQGNYKSEKANFQSKTSPLFKDCFAPQSKSPVLSNFACTNVVLK